MNAHAQETERLDDRHALQRRSERTALQVIDPALEPVTPDDLQPVADDVLDALAAELSDIKRRMTLKLTLMWGERIFTVVYGSDIERMRARTDKDVSLRRLAERMGENASVLHHAVNLYDFSRRHPRLLDDPRLTTTHFRMVLPLPDHQRVELLERAAEEGWTTQELDRHARVEKKRLTRGRGGRPRLPQGIKTINSMDKWARRPEVHFDGLDDMTRLTLGKARKMRLTIDVVMRQLQRARRRLDDHLEQLGEQPEAE